MPDKIERLKAGDKERTARHADVMNELIDRLNALTNMTVSPQELGKFVYSDGNVVLALNVTDCGAADTSVDGGSA